MPRRSLKETISTEDLQLIYSKLQGIANITINSSENWCDDWSIIKRFLINSIEVRLRKLFSKKNPRTNKMRQNTLELEICKEWKRITGKKPKIKRIASWRNIEKPRKFKKNSSS